MKINLLQLFINHLLKNFNLNTFNYLRGFFDLEHVSQNGKINYTKFKISVSRNIFPNIFDCIIKEREGKGVYQVWKNLVKLESFFNFRF